MREHISGYTYTHYFRLRVAASVSGGKTVCDARRMEQAVQQEISSYHAAERASKTNNCPHMVAYETGGGSTGSADDAYTGCHKLVFASIVHRGVLVTPKYTLLVIEIGTPHIIHVFIVVVVQTICNKISFL